MSLDPYTLPSLPPPLSSSFSLFSSSPLLLFSPSPLPSFLSLLFTSSPLCMVTIALWTHRSNVSYLLWSHFSFSVNLLGKDSLVASPACQTHCVWRERREHPAQDSYWVHMTFGQSFPCFPAWEGPLCPLPISVWLSVMSLETLVLNSNCVYKQRSKY